MRGVLWVSSSLLTTVRMVGSLDKRIFAIKMPNLTLYHVTNKVLNIRFDRVYKN